MVTAHPHPRVPQRPSLAPRAARKGWVGASQPCGHTSTALVALATKGVSKCAAAKWQKALKIPYPSNPPAEDPGIRERLAPIDFKNEVQSGIMGRPSFHALQV